MRIALLAAVGCSLLLSGCQSLVGQMKPDSGPGVSAETVQEPVAAPETASPALLDPQTLAELDHENRPLLPEPEDSAAIQPDADTERAEQTEVAAAEPEQAAGDGETLPADLWQRTRENFQLDLDQGDRRVEAQLKWYASHPGYLERVAKRASRYYHYVLNEILARGLPAELALLPIVESAYDPFAYSHGRAAGPWQFIPGTARHYGLRMSWWYDGRRDIVASTQAALDYLTRLRDQFDGDWLLALASYNAGEGNVLRAVKRNRKRGKPTDFWHLDLPRETSAYVPKLIALARLVADPAQYEVALPYIPDEPYFEIVDVGSQIDLAKAAELAGVAVEELYLLNPGFNQWATDPEGPHRLLVPVQAAERFRLALNDYPPEKRVSWKRYKVRPGDSLIRIAKAHHVTPETLRSVNGIGGNLIRAGEALLIPTASEPATTYAYSVQQRQKRKNESIALRGGRQRVDYVVQPGDSFWDIAQSYGVGVRELAAWNQMAPGDPLRVGKKLVIWQPRTALAGNSGSRQVIRKIGYRVRSGDSLSSIASRFRVRVSDIRKWNNELASRKYLQPGDLLTLYVDVTRR